VTENAITPLKRKAFILWAILLIGAIADGFLWGNKLIGDVFGGVLLAASLGIPFLIVSRFKCPTCTKRLADQFPVGSLILIGFARQKCKNCGSLL